MKILDQLTEKLDEEKKSALADMMKEDFEDSFKFVRKVIGSKGKKSAAFAVLYGKNGSQLIPWMIIQKAAGPALSKLKKARKQAKEAAPGTFLNGARFAKGSVTYHEGQKRLVFELSGGTLSKTLLSKTFDKPAKAFKTDPTPQVKKLVALLKDAIILDEGETLDEAATPAADNDALNEILGETFSESDLSDLQDAVGAKEMWGGLTATEQEELDELQKSASSESADAIMDALMSSTDPEERAELWLEYRQNAPITSKPLEEGSGMSEEQVLEQQQALLAKRYAVQRRARFHLDRRETLLRQMNAITSREDISDDQVKEFMGLQKEFSSLGNTWRTLEQEITTLTTEISALTPQP